MNATFQQAIQEQARRDWEDGQPYQAGRAIFEYIPVASRSVWAYGILSLAAPYFPHDPRVEAVLDFARCPMQWSAGRGELCERTRRIIAAVDGGQAAPLMFSLAAQAGKIVYTAQQYPAPFEHHAGWKIAVVLWQIAHKLCDNEFATQAWLTLAKDEFIQLEQPVICHPACPTCRANGPMRVPIMVTEDELGHRIIS